MAYSSLRNSISMKMVWGHIHPHHTRPTTTVASRTETMARSITAELRASELHNGISTWREKIDGSLAEAQSRLERGEPYYR